jgi:predicted nucleotidyltransferase
MLAMNQIEEFGRRIGRQCDAHKVILFGSYVRDSRIEQISWLW